MSAVQNGFIAKFEHSTCNHNNSLVFYILPSYDNYVCRCSSVGVAAALTTRESNPSREHFPHPSRTPIGPTLLYNEYRVSFPGVKRPWRDAEIPLPSSKKIDVKESRNRPGVAQRVPGGLGSQIHDIRHIKVVRYSASRTGSLYPRNVPSTHFH